MAGNRRVSFDRTRQLFRLLGELREFGARQDAALAHLTAGLLALIPAQVLIVGKIEDRPEGGISLRGIAEDGWSSNAERLRVREFFERNGLTADPLARALTSAPLTGVFTARRRDVISRREWHESEFFREARHPNGADDAIYSQRALGNDAREAIGFTRAAGDRPFSEEDRDLAHLAHLGLSDFLDRNAHCDANERSARLSPRQRQTLAALLRGRSDKEIGVELGIGRNTVNKHVMAVLRAYGVTSRAQLIATALGTRFTEP